MPSGTAVAASVVGVASGATTAGSPGIPVACDVSPDPAEADPSLSAPSPWTSGDAGADSEPTAPAPEPAGSGSAGPFAACADPARVDGALTLALDGALAVADEPDVEFA